MIKLRVSFEEWEKSVNAICVAMVGLGIDDCFDWPSRQSYDDGLTPMEGFQVWWETQQEY